MKRPPRALIGCEFSGKVRAALEKRGWFVRSVDLLPTELHSQPVKFRGDAEESQSLFRSTRRLSVSAATPLLAAGPRQESAA